MSQQDSAILRMLSGHLFVFTLLSGLQSVHAGGSHISNDTSKYRHIPEHAMVSTFIETYGQVFHMEPDLYIPGNVIYSDHCILKTTDGITSSIISGHAECYSHKWAGDITRFWHLTGFRQISPSKVVVVDSLNHCLKLIDRVTLHVSRYAGVCESGGYAEGTGDAQFDLPYSVVTDIKNPDMLLVTDTNNAAVRHVTILTSTLASVTNFATNLAKPHGITQHPVTGDMYVTDEADSKIWKILYSNQTAYLFAGGTAGHRDWNILKSYFNRPSELIFISDNDLLVADTVNHRLRVLGPDTSSMCTGSDGHIDGGKAACTLFYPRALMVLNDTLYVGEIRRIRMVRDQRLRACSANKVPIVASEDTGLAELNLLPLAAGIEKIQLPPGTYPFTINSDIVNCTVDVKVIVHHVRRRLYFESEYSLGSCEADAGDLSKSSDIYATVKHRQLSDVCQRDCNRARSEDILLKCENATLTISWPTNLVYNGSVVTVPARLNRRLNERIEDIGAAFHLVILTQNNPVVYPDITSNGGYVKAVLYSFCNAKGYTYNDLEDTCEK